MTEEQMQRFLQLYEQLDTKNKEQLNRCIETMRQTWYNNVANATEMEGQLNG